MAHPKRQQTRTSNFRSGFEKATADDLTGRSVAFSYEAIQLEYTVPEKVRKYTPDFVIVTTTGKQIIIETKGQFVTSDRQKMLLVKEQHPDLDIRVVFSNSNNRISKRSKTTYAAWCERYGFQYANRVVPEEWLNE